MKYRKTLLCYIIILYKSYVRVYLNLIVIYKTNQIRGNDKNWIVNMNTR